MAPPAVGHSSFSPKSTKSSVGPGSPGSSGHGAASLAVGAGAGGFGAGVGAGAALGSLPRTRNRTPRVGLPAIMVGSVKIPTSALSQPEGPLPSASTRVLIFVALATRLLSTLLNDKMNLFFSLAVLPAQRLLFHLQDACACGFSCRRVRSPTRISSRSKGRDRLRLACRGHKNPESSLSSWCRFGVGGALAPVDGPSWFGLNVIFALGHCCRHAAANFWI